MCGKLTFILFGSIGCESLFSLSHYAPFVKPEPVPEPVREEACEEEDGGHRKGDQGEPGFSNVTIKTYIFRTLPERELTKYFFIIYKKILFFCSPVEHVKAPVPVVRPHQLVEHVANSAKKRFSNVSLSKANMQCHINRITWK